MYSRKCWMNSRSVDESNEISGGLKKGACTPLLLAYSA